MKNFALDLWDDLRDKRLWPIAAALLVAVVAIPLFVMKPAEEATPGAPPPSARPSTPATPAVQVEDQTVDDSRLEVFGKKDPFRPPAKVLKPAKSTATASGSAAKAGPSPTAPVKSGSSAGSAPAPKSGSGGTTTPSVPKTLARPKTYTYVIDLDFGREGHVRRRRGVKRLTILPSSTHPVAVFLGVTATSKRAVFLLNPSFDQRGQGTCRPSKTTCTFLYLGTDPEKNGHYVKDDDGTTYVMRLKDIRRVPLSKVAKASRKSKPSSAGAAISGFALPVFLDERR